MKKLVVNFITILMLGSILTAQVIEGMAEFNFGEHNALQLKITDVDKKLVQNTWKNYTKQFGKPDKKNGEYITKDANLAGLTNSVDWYFKVAKDDGSVTAFLCIISNEEFLSSVRQKTNYDVISQYFSDFKLAVDKAKVTRELKTEKKELAKLKKKQKKLEKDYKKNEKSIEKNRKKIKKAEKNIASNLNLIEENKVKISKQISIVSDLSEKTANSIKDSKVSKEYKSENEKLTKLQKREKKLTEKIKDDNKSIKKAKEKIKKSEKKMKSILKEQSKLENKIAEQDNLVNNLRKFLESM